LNELNIPLVLRAGAADKVILDVVAESGATAVTWNRRYGAPEIAIDTQLKAQLRGGGVQVESFQASLLFEPWTISTGQGTSYSVFTPFWRACHNALEPREPLPTPRPVSASVSAMKPTVASDTLAAWALQPTNPDWAQGLREAWTPGE